jgi:hypothetical protein
VREVLDAALKLPGYRGILAFTLPEALWLAEEHDDIVLGYPSVDRAALAALAGSAEKAARITLMVDDLAQLDLVDSVAAPGQRAEIRVAIDADASWRAPVLGHIGVRRSPVHDPDEVQRLARAIAARPGFRLVGLMMYEAQIAGQPDDTGSGDAVIRWMQRRSTEELRERRGAIVGAVRDVADLEFVNGGGTGSLEYTASDPPSPRRPPGADCSRATCSTSTGTSRSRPRRRSRWRSSATRGRHRDGPRRRLDRLRPAGRLPAAAAGVADGPATLAREGAGEVQTPLQGGGASLSSATVSGSATRRAASSPNASIATTSRAATPRR